MKEKSHRLTRRERQIMDVIYGRGEASAADVQAALPDAPGYSAVRALLRILENKGFLKHREDGPRYLYLPTQAVEHARRSALKQIVSAFFEGSLANAVASLVDANDGKLDPEELRRLEAIIKKAKSK
ncbi:MAG: BlaI/MecI/CopY family transcriptional regulator [Verrucomicrobia bacterium]|nr:BlaI/MecI/CopY family transcriptional regulator [Verrucomicrobiota bacterium]